MTHNRCEWANFLEEGEKYLTTSKRGLSRSQIFTPTILYNLVSLAVEKYVMGFLIAHHQMPEGHTLNDLVRAMTDIVDMDEGLINQLEYYDQQQQICHLTSYHRQVCTEDEIRSFIAAADEVKRIVESNLPGCELTLPGR